MVSEVNWLHGYMFLNIVGITWTSYFTLVSLNFCVLAFQKFEVRKNPRWRMSESVEGPHCWNQSETRHNPCQSVECPNGWNQSETEHCS